NGGVERDRMLRYAGNTKVVAHAADAEEQRVVGQSARGQDLFAVVERHCAKLELMSSSIETGNRALTETKMMPMRERQVVDIVHIDVHSPRGDLVQQWLPNVRRELIDQRDFGRAFSRKLVAQR